jgi:hypothetical protein
MAEFSYTGPGYPNLSSAGDQMMGGLKGLADMQARSDASRMEQATSRADSIRQERVEELGRQKSMLAFSMEDRKLDLESAKAYADMRRGELMERKAHIELSEFERALAREAEADQFLRDNPPYESMVQQALSGDPWNSLKAAWELGNTGQLDKLPSQYQQPVRKVLEQLAPGKGQAMVHIVGRGQVPLTHAFQMEKNPSQFDRVAAAAARLQVTGSLPSGAEVSPAIRFAAEQFNLSTEEHATLISLEQSGPAIAALRAEEKNPELAAEEREAARQMRVQMEAGRLKDLVTFGEDRWNRYRDLKAGRAIVSHTEAAQMLEESFPATPTPEWLAQLAPFSGETSGDPEKQQAAAMDVYMAARSELEELSGILHKGEEATPAEVAKASTAMLIGYYPMIQGLLGQRSMNPAEAFSPHQRVRAAASVAAYEKNREMVSQAQQEGRPVDYADAHYGGALAYIATGDTSNLSAPLRSAVDYLNAGIPEDATPVERRAWEKEERDYVIPALVDTGMLIRDLGEDGRPRYEIASDAVIKVQEAWGPARTAYRGGVELSRELRPPKDRGAAAVNSMAMNLLHGTQPALDTFLAGRPVPRRARFPVNSWPSANVFQQRNAGTELQPGSGKYAALNNVVAGYQIDELTQAGQALGAVRALESDFAGRSSVMKKNAKEAADSIANALGAFNRYAEILGKDEAAYRRASYGSLAEQLGPAASVPLAELRYVLSSQDEAATEIRKALVTNLPQGVRLEDLYEYLVVDLPPVPAIAPAAVPAAPSKARSKGSAAEALKL